MLTGGTLDKINNQAQGANAPWLQLTLQVVPAATPPSGGNLCGSDQGQTPTTKKVMIIWEENKSWIDQGEGTAEMPALDGDTQDAPYVNSLASNCAVVSNNQLPGEAGYQSYDHGSLGNYMAVATGDLSAYEGAPWSGDCAANSLGCTTNEPSIFSQGASWKAYAESMDSGCENHDGGGTFSSADSGGSENRGVLPQPPQSTGGLHQSGRVLDQRCGFQPQRCGTGQSALQRRDVRESTDHQLGDAQQSR